MLLQMFQNVYIKCYGFLLIIEVVCAPEFLYVYICFVSHRKHIIGKGNEGAILVLVEIIYTYAYKELHNVLCLTHMMLFFP